MPRPLVLLAQLPIPQPSPVAATGNVPLAAGCLTVALRQAAAELGVPGGLDIEILPPALTDPWGDRYLADWIAAREPAILGLSLYLWNSERSLHLGREVKRRSPRTRVLIGGPEVTNDNGWLLLAEGWDAAVTGEAEESVVPLVAAVLAGRDPTGLPAVSVRAAAGPTPFAPSSPPGFSLNRFPSPYVAGVLPVEAARSTYVETVRGCRSHCTFCFYPRSSAVLRSLDPAAAAALVAACKDGGAREVVFLDPTFNHRPQIDELLAELAKVNHDRALTFFAEVRAEGLTAAHAAALAGAGFNKLEIGLQSVRKETLKITERGGDPQKVAAAAKLLHGAGIELLVDLIIGLPGDGAADVAAGMDFLKEHGLADEAQVFPLSILPGTAMRSTAEQDGVVFDERPPYRVRRTRLLDEDGLAAALADAEERLERRLDEQPRPFLVREPEPGGTGDVVRLDLDGAIEAGWRQEARAGHLSLWLEAGDLFAHRDDVRAQIEARLRDEPYATLDVILRGRSTFPVDLLVDVRRQLAAAEASYASRALAHRGEDAQRRLSVVWPRGARLDDDYLLELGELAGVYCEGSPAEVLATDDEAPHAWLITTAVDDGAWKRLAAHGDPERIAFADRTLERRWVRQVLSYQDVREGSGLGAGRRDGERIVKSG